MSSPGRDEPACNCNTGLCSQDNTRAFAPDDAPHFWHDKSFQDAGCVPYFYYSDRAHNAFTLKDGIYLNSTFGCCFFGKTPHRKFDKPI
jgi:hypothetical protein